MVGGTMKLQDMNDLYNQAHNQLVAQAKAIHLCHELCPDAMIGPAPNITTAYPADSNPENYLAALNNDDLRNNFYLDALVFGRYPASMNNYFEKNGIHIEGPIINQHILFIVSEPIFHIVPEVFK